MRHTDRDKQLGVAFDPEHSAKIDESRERRLMPGEDEKIRAVMNKEKNPGRERPLKMENQAALGLLYDLGLETAMRMREMYTLNLDQVSIEKRTVFLDRTKNGSMRQFPLLSVAITKIEEYISQVVNGTRGMEGFKFEGNLLFPWWNGSLEDVALRTVTGVLSGRFRTIFMCAGADDFRLHDLRHEATSRLFERTQLSDFEIMKITGHSSTRMLARYANLRGSNLASRLW